MGTPVWSHDGIVALANPHTGKVKLTFSQGAHLPGPKKLFNVGLGGNLWRAVDLFETGPLREEALEELIRAAVSFHRAKLAGKAPSTRRPRVTRTSSSHLTHRKST